MLSGFRPSRCDLFMLVQLGYHFILSLKRLQSQTWGFFYWHTSQVYSLVSTNHFRCCSRMKQGCWGGGAQMWNFAQGPNKSLSRPCDKSARTYILVLNAEGNTSNKYIRPEDTTGTQQPLEDYLAWRTTLRVSVQDVETSVFLFFLLQPHVSFESESRLQSPPESRRWVLSCWTPHTRRILLMSTVCYFELTNFCHFLKSRSERAA